MSSSINCISLNCRGLNSYEKRTYLYDWVKDNNIDIACLQETHFVEKSSFKYDARWQGQSFHSYSDTPHGRGVTVLFKDKFEAEIINVYKSLDGRRILIIPPATKLGGGGILESPCPSVCLSVRL